MVLVHDFWRGENLTACPASLNEAGSLRLEHHLSTVGVYFTWGILALVFAAVTAKKFNSVWVYEQRHRMPRISNTLWVVFYVANVGGAFANGFRYLFTIDRDAEQPRLADTILFLAAALCDGFAGSVLIVALNHQRMHRSSDSSMNLQGNTEPNPALGTRTALQHAPVHTDPAFASLAGAGSNDPTDDPDDTGTAGPLVLSARAGARHRGQSMVALACMLYLINSCAVLLQILGHDHAAIFWLCMSALWAQAVVQIVLALVILLSRRKFGVGRQAKMVLATAAVLTNINILPPTVWQSFLPRTCVFYFASWVDFLLLFDATSLVFFFAFLRLEFLRNRDAAVYSTVSRIVDTHGYKQF